MLELHWHIHSLRGTGQPMHDDSLSTFIDRWTKSGGAERANYQLWLAELCDCLAVARPDPSVEDDAQNAYVFERGVRFDDRDGTHSTKRIDLYKRGCFVCETKQGVQAEEEKLVLSAKQAERHRSRKKGHGTRGTPAWDDAMLLAVGQAEQYARALLAEEGRPPFLVVIDVGDSIEFYAEFSQTGGAYVAFPDHRSHRIKLAQRADPDIRERLRLVWTDPLSLDPARRTAKMTREIAAKLAELAKSLEATGQHRPEDVAHFLMRCLHTMHLTGLLKSSFLAALFVVMTFTGRLHFRGCVGFGDGERAWHYRRPVALWV